MGETPIDPTRVEGWDVQSLAIRQAIDLRNGEVVYVLELLSTLGT